MKRFYRRSVSRIISGQVVKQFLSVIWPVLATLAFVGLLLGIPAFLISRAEHRHDVRLAEEERQCGLYASDIVEAVIDGRRGMVTNYQGSYVWIRFAQPSATTDVALLGADGAISNAPYSTVRMSCFEVRKVC